MRHYVLSMLGAIALVATAGTAGANDPVIDFSDLAARYQFFEVLDVTDGQVSRFAYADAQQHVHVFTVEDGEPDLEWESTNLGSRASAFLVRDLDDDGDREIVIATKAGRILVHDVGTYDLIWENLQNPFPRILCLTAADIDQDPQEEFIFIAGEQGGTHLNIWDGLNFTLEWQSERQYSAEQILIANMDNDEQPEIILNTGLIVDSRFYNLDLSAPRFGDRISLCDVNGDGIPEIIGNNPDFTIRVYDVYGEREVW